MADFAVAQDVFDASWDHIDPSRETWISTQIGRAETLLKTKVTRLQNVSSLSELDAANANTAVVNAVLRFIANPKGIKQESVQDQSVTRFEDARGGGIYFTDEELSWFRPTARRRVGNIGVAPPKWGQV
ncbi:hypothetical protein HOT75_gp019 [Gordonia phage Daredevil]|uniref:Head-to-tail adaptor n=1 Tax=Gordonia phage Daredevil TaxID=2283286 RepID=A0A345MIM6_9CAUD|nr:hypothetical protein HOT75_gp019 [Gordonia phage Daredevil]AXH70407.1 hypothetical protein SEA_DAREDEVIL_19 [Gordonia phage Daredevil]